jgi:cardiolipin synthase A/B
MSHLRSSISKKLDRFRARRAETAPRRRRRAAKFRLGMQWILLIVLVGVLGLLLYSSSARILKDPIVSTLDVGDPLFPGSIGPLLGAEFLDGNTIEPLINGKEIFPAMLDAIRKAEKSITLESYIWASGVVSDQFCAALIERAQHGVKIHALVDGAGNLKLKLSDVNRMKAAGIEFVVYGRERWYHLKLDLNHRSHRKLLIVDGKVGFTGGVCIDDTWLGDGDHPGVWRETQARITGPVVRQMQAVFATNWLQTTSRLLSGPDYFPETPRTGRANAHCFMSGPNEQPENARLSYLLAIASARKTIQLSHAYFVPDELAIEMLLAARQRGVKIEVIVPFKNDSRSGRAASRSRWGRLLEAGVEFHYYLPSLYHCKLMIVDDTFMSLGSVNFDNRSFSINDEVNINVVDRATVRAFQRSFADDMAKSRPLTYDEFVSRPVYVKAGDHFFGIFRALF